MRLFTVNTIATEYGAYRSVPLVWFRRDPPGEPRPYAELVENYESGDRHLERAIDELLTESEANALKKYLDRLDGGIGITTIKEVDLPIKNDAMAVGAISICKSSGYYHRLDAEDEYPLSFKVSAYFNCTDCDLYEMTDDEVAELPGLAV